MSKVWTCGCGQSFTVAEVFNAHHEQCPMADWPRNQIAELQAAFCKVNEQLQTPEGLNALLDTTKAGRDLLKETSKERQLKTRVTDKFADYCIERNELEAALRKVERERDEALVVLKEIVAISDRNHNAWDRAHVLLDGKVKQ